MANYKRDSFDDVYNSTTPTLDVDSGEWTYTDSFGRTREELLEAYTERTNELDSIAKVYRTADKIITGDSDLDVRVIEDKELDTTALNNGKEIIFNANLIEDLDSETIASLHGTNYHEVAHILFSPRAGSALAQYAKDNRVTECLNLLEESRIEQLLIAKYPSTRLFLEHNVLDYLLKGSPSEWGYFYHLITGRTYLDIEIRQMIADKAIEAFGIDVVEELNYIIHQYRDLVFPTDFDRAKVLLERMAKLYGKDKEQESLPKDSHSDRQLLQRGRPAGKAEQDKLQAKSKKDNEGTPKESLKANIGVGSDSTEYDTSEADPYSDEDKAIADKVTERVKAIKNTKSVRDKISETRRAIIGNDEIRSPIREADYQERTPSSTSVSYARKFGTQLERIVRDNDSQWETHKPSGRLNISRTMNPDVNAIGEMFDQWDIGNPNTDIEAVILMDNSGSMGGYMGAVCENAWIIKRGIENINGAVTVFAFDHESKKMYDRTERAKANTYRHIWSRGNTDPLRALIESERILNASDKPIKMLFVITDGQWYNNVESDNVISRLNNNGVVTSVVFLSNYREWKELLESARDVNAPDYEYANRLVVELRHNAKVFRAVANPSDVLKVADDLVKSTLVRKVA